MGYKLSIIFMLALVIWGTAIGTAEEPVKDIYYYYNAFTAAYNEQDYQGFLENLKGALGLRPEHPRIMYNMACAYALTGDSERAYLWLERLTRGGMAYGAGSDSAFVSIWGEERFKAITQDIERNRQRVGTSEAVNVLPEEGLILESVAFEEGGERQFFSSVRQRKILVTEGETIVDFSRPQDQLMGVFGLKTDAERGVLWACTAAVPQMEGYTEADEGKTSLVGYDLATGNLIHRYPVPEDGDPHLLGDMVVAADGALFATDSYAPRLYWLPPGGTALEVFVELRGFVSPQGLAQSPDGRTLYVADYLNGIASIDLVSRDQRILTHPSHVIVFGIDGLYSYGGDLIAIQNGVNPNRVVRFHLQRDSISGCTVLEANNPEFEEPTLGVIRGQDFYFVGSSQWGAYDGQGQPAEGVELVPHRIFKTSLH